MHLWYWYEPIQLAAAQAATKKSSKFDWIYITSDSNVSPEDGGSMFLLNTDTCPQVHIKLQLRIPTYTSWLYTNTHLWHSASVQTLLKHTVHPYKLVQVRVQWQDLVNMVQVMKLLFQKRLEISTPEQPLASQERCFIIGDTSSS
jgi:hypothetical protein